MSTQTQARGRYKVYRDVWESDGEVGWSVDFYREGEWTGGVWWPTWSEAIDYAFERARLLDTP